MMPTINTTTPSPKTVFFGVSPNAEKHGLPLLDFFVKKNSDFIIIEAQHLTFFSKKSQKRSINLYIS